MKLSGKKLVSFVLLAVVFNFVMLPAVVLAEEPQGVELDFEQIKAEALKVVSESPIAQCQQSLVPAYDIELLEFLQFLDDNFKNKSANSSLTNIAITGYGRYKKAIEAVFAELRPNLVPGSETNLISTEVEGYQSCADITDRYITLAKEKMLEHIKNTSAQKKTTMMVEKYQAINAKLRNMNLAIAQMYGMFMSFKEKLPGFLQECTKK